MNLKVLYEDNHLIAVFKPVGVLSQEDSTGKISIYDQVKQYLKEKYKKPGNVFLGILQRLDRPVSGIILFAKTSKGQKRLAEQFRNRKVEKIYHGIIIGKPKQKRGEIKGEVKKVSFFAQAIFGQDTSQILKNLEDAIKTRSAELYYEVLRANEKYSLVKIMPKTGRFHQIRIQFASMGNPILGDKKYGAPFSLKDKSIALCATGLSFYCATGGKKINLSIPIPGDWNKYI